MYVCLPRGARSTASPLPVLACRGSQAAADSRAGALPVHAGRKQMCFLMNGVIIKTSNSHKHGRLSDEESIRLPTEMKNGSNFNFQENCKIKKCFFPHANGLQ